uniref:Uncharacterized protein n=1 Tax=Oryza sativa subsp. japonica TaxID=39947 RepID=Q69U78_ORYSJ|nr:hypothetical protein [Oryza sativa Japonica Group]
MVWPWNLPSRNNGPVHNSAQTWRRPPISWVKANTDWAFVMAHKFRAVEVVMRNDSGVSKLIIETGSLEVTRMVAQKEVSRSIYGSGTRSEIEAESFQ